MIKQWQTVYFEYLTHQNIAGDQQEQLWCDKTNNLIAYWNNMQSGEAPQIYRSFSDLLATEIQHYTRLNVDFYRRGFKVQPQVTNNGGRYWK